MQIVSGILALLAGVGLNLKTEWVMQNFGSIEWFEDKLRSSGGSRLGYKLLGVILIVIGMIMATGSGDDFFTWLLAPLTKYSAPQQ